MEGNLPRGCSDVAAMHVRNEAVDENTSALVLGSQEPPAPCGDTACGGGGGGKEEAAEELADAELHAAATTSSVLLYRVSTERFFTTAGEGKTYLKIAPASAMPSAPPENTLPTGSDFSSKAVLCLIEAVGRRWGLYETRERSQLFQSVQEEMASKGHVLPVEKIRRKWNNLIVTYKRVKDRSRETGHAKTSWEFFDLMDATLCDTVGSQIINNKRHKTGNTFSSQPTPLAKVASKPKVAPSTSSIRPNGDFTSPDVASAGRGAVSSQMVCGSGAITSATISPTHSPELKPLIGLNNEIVTNIHPASIVPTPAFISTPVFTEAASTTASLNSTSTTDLHTSRYTGCKAPSLSSGVIPFRLSTNQSLLGLSNSLPPNTSCLTSPLSTSLSAAVLSGADGQNQNQEQCSTVMFQEVLRRQEEQTYLERVARRRVEAREKRRERRETRMAESLGRIATALELLSSKQDTVIALLQRLADRK
ncbi:uncharacterized protein LOC141809463 isoform X1 [Halichoeres trimaculatus]|uniref:uncharacterized protein LOC141809463 isoform X1 n=1 Tax=Halichoeres trimaculatus TaxID=147232 RepID=UPI003D9E1E9B